MPLPNPDKFWTLGRLAEDTGVSYNDLRRLVNDAGIRPTLTLNNLKFYGGDELVALVVAMRNERKATHE